MNFQKFKTLTFRKKLGFLWEYYHWHMAVILVVGCLLGSWFYGIATKSEPLLTISMINAYGQTPNGEILADFLEDQGYAYYPDAVVIDKNIQLNNEDPTMSMMGNQLLFCTIAAGEADVFFWETKELQPALEQDVLMDLRDVLSPEILEYCRDSLVYTENTDTGELYPCSVYLDHNPWIEGNLFYVNCSVGIPYSVKNLDLASAFLEYIIYDTAKGSD